VAPRQGVAARRGRAFVALLALAAGCRSASPCGADRPALVELRDGAGALQLSARQPPPDNPQVLTVCDGAGRPLGALSEAAAPRAVTMVDGRGSRVASIDQPGGDAPRLAVAGRGDFALREQGSLLRLLDPRGVPLAQLSRDGERALALDPGGTPQASVESTGGRYAILARDGAVRGYVIGARDDRAAAAFAVDALPPEARLVLERWLEPPAR
jgi:hypothetical protein